jgi:hypothetical protein
MHVGAGQSHSPAHLALGTRGANEVWKLGEKGVDRRTATNDFHAGGLRTGSLGKGQTTT